MDGIKLPDLRKYGQSLVKRKIILVAALIIIPVLVTGIWAEKKINIIADGKNISVITFYRSPEKVLAQAGVCLGLKDEYRSSTPILINGATIEVFRAIPVTVVLPNQTKAIITGKPTVGELAASYGFTTQNSRTLPGWDTRLTTAMHVRIIALSEKLVTQKMPLPAPVVRQPDANMEKDEETVEQSGSEGLIEAVVKLRFEDGKQVAADIITEKVLTDAVPEIVRVGTRDMVETSRGNMRFRSVHWMAGSAYLPTDGSGRGITACGLRARQGIVAVDPAVIPLGSRLYIPGYGMALAADTGGAIVGNRIDLCMESRRAAMSFGRRQVKVYIIDE